MTLGEYAYPAVQRAAKSADIETARRAQSLLKTIREKIPEEKRRVKGHDVVHTIDFAIAGHIKPSALKARTAYFGDIQLKLSEVRNINWQIFPRNETEVSVDAAQYATQNEQWFATEIETSTEMQIDVSTSGTVDLWPLPGGVGQWTAGPRGQGNWGGGMGMGGPAQFPPGALIGKVGERAHRSSLATSTPVSPSPKGNYFYESFPARGRMNRRESTK